MKDLRSSRRLIQKWHRREKATLDHLISTVGIVETATGRIHPALTASGLAVEDQVRKAWAPAQVGLPIF
jgi:hypothetical protein